MLQKLETRIGEVLHSDNEKKKFSQRRKHFFHLLRLLDIILDDMLVSDPFYIIFYLVCMDCDTTDTFYIRSR